MAAMATSTDMATPIMALICCTCSSMVVIIYSLYSASGSGNFCTIRSRSSSRACSTVSRVRAVSW